MKMDGLIRYGAPAEVIGLWKERESEALLPLQEVTVKQNRLFGGGNLLIQAPTFSGKTFIGEMAAVETALRRKKVVYLVPLKALAEEKYQSFREKYEAYGLKVIVSSRDHREFDAALESGDFSVAVVVYEKLAQLLVRRPERLQEIELIIADELELLSDPERGGGFELLLTRILVSGTRLIGLSAVIGQADKLAEWMEAKLVLHEQRSVELRYGVLHEGVFRYRTYNAYSEGEETLAGASGEPSWEVLAQNVGAFAERGETCLVYVKSKQESRRGAKALADRMEGAAAREAIEALRALEPTRSRNALIEGLERGVGFHNTDLTPGERAVVEEGFRSGELRVMVSTSTLAVGLNMPARNVFITADKWRYDARFGMPWKAPIVRAEYEHMGGRAGRYGQGHEFGRSILIADTPFDAETLWRRYVEGEREGIEPCLSKGPLENYVLQLVASRCCQTEDELLNFLENTLTGEWVWREMYTLEEVELLVRAAINRAADTGMMAREGEGTLEATPLGRAVAAKGVSIATALELQHWISESETRVWSNLDLIFAAASTPDGRIPTVTLTSDEYETAGYVERMKRAAEGEDDSADVPLNSIRNCHTAPFFEEVRAVKIALFLGQWIDHAPVRELEQDYETMSGQVLAAAQQVSWLLDAAASIAGALGSAEELTARIRMLSERAQKGLLEEALPLSRLSEPELPRPVICALVAHGFHRAAALAAAPTEVLAQWMPKKDARALISWANKRAAAQEEDSTGTEQQAEASAILIVDDRVPGQAILDGVAVRLQEKQYLLVRALAEFPGECVPYDAIYDAVWGDAVVENNQMHFQKRKLLDRIKAAVPQYAELVKTVPKRGFVLNLAPSQVERKLTAVSSAA
jgi:helicase